ncbi:hypothetical protein A4A49_02572 [Nicotiana attenuata]|uniref:F-box protein At3g26010-like beta-propeller domain-containing protein n=2 Tax=Nicotiana attenuata TaxID=49451 RepID=A0A1J6J142_NICAT|nr:hypothetical protein A4A49_02572 [Nicotiana attenuata]
MNNYMKSSSTMNYYICNIVTRQWIALPPAPSGRGHFGENVGFLIEPNSKDNHQYMYLVLRFIPCGYSEFLIEKFSSEQGKWTKLVVTSPRILNCWCSTHKISLIACEKMLFTTVHETSIIVDCILAFDPFNDPAPFLRIIDLPLEARHIGGVCKLGVCQGRLRFSQIVFLQASPSRYPSISIWELEDYRTGKWCLVYKKILTNPALRCPLTLRYDSTDMNPEICVLAFDPYNENLVYFLVGYSVVAYNIQTEKVENSSWPSLLIKLQGSTRELTTYYGSNVLPLTQNWWPTPVLRQPL